MPILVRMIAGQVLTGVVAVVDFIHEVLEQQEEEEVIYHYYVEDDGDLEF
jgi:hypothetical protein